ncbi:hypothetical protein GCM10027569_91820 [Flindersiella endophytica]
MIEETFLSTTCGPGITFLLCDDQCHGKAAVPVDGAPPDPPFDECLRIASAFASLAGKEHGALLLVIERAGPESIVQSDIDWLRAMRETCAEHRVRLLGVWVVTPRQAREVALDDLPRAGLPTG